MPIRTVYHGRELTTPETFGPTFESMIIILCLKAIHPDLPNFIMDNKGMLFSRQTPNFCDIKNEICDTMDTILAQMESQNIQRLNIKDGRCENIRYSSLKSGGTPPKNTVQLQKKKTQQKKICEYCQAMGKDERLWSSHDKYNCFGLFPEKRRNNKQYSRMLSVPVYTDENDSWDLQEALTAVENQFNAFQMGEDPIENEDPQ